MEIMHKNYKSDFDAILHLKSCVGDVCKEIGWPGYDWVAKFYTTSHDNVYIASNVGGVLTNCFNDNGNIHVVFNNHGLLSGTLRVEFSAEIPNGIYPDGSQLEVSPQPLDIELVRGRGDCGTIVDVDVMLSYIKGDKGDTGPQGPKGDKGDTGSQGPKGDKGDKGDAFTYEDFTAEQIAELQRSATEAAESVSKLEEEVSQAEALRASAEQTRKANEQSRISAENGRVSGENERKANEAARQSNEATRIANENQRQQNEKSRVSAETARAEEFATWEGKIDSKQDALTTSEDLSISASNELSLTDKAKKQLFIDMWNEACSYNGEAGYFGQYNEATGFFELNELTDITYAEALKIYRLSYKQPISAAAQIFGGWPSFHGNINCRTYLPIVGARGYTGPDLTRAYFRNDILETVAFMGGYDRGPGNFANLDRTFDGCTRLRKIIGGIGGSKFTANTFYGCEALEYVDLHHKLSNLTVDLQWSPKLTYDTFDTLVKKSSLSTNDPGTFTMTVHPDVYAKLTGDTTNEAAGALTAEELAQWQQLVTDAAAKNISFATV